MVYALVLHDQVKQCHHLTFIKSGKLFQAVLRYVDCPIHVARIDRYHYRVHCLTGDTELCYPRDCVYLTAFWDVPKIITPRLFPVVDDSVDCAKIA